MGKRLPIILSCVALVVVVLGSTPLGQAAIDAVPALAKRALVADTAKNALQVNKIKVSRKPTAGMLLPLDATGKFPASVGAIGAAGPAGPQGAKGDKGDAGTSGISNIEIVNGSSANNTSTGLKTATATCPSGKKAIGGGAEIQSSPIYPITVNKPLTDLSGWTASGYKETASGAFWGVVAYAVCATVT
jgi:hypothetical protein